MNKEITQRKTISRKLICYPAFLISKEQFFAEYLANDISCKLPPFAMGVSVYISTLTMTIIAIDRYVLIIYYSVNRECKFYKKLSLS